MKMLVKWEDKRPVPVSASCPSIQDRAPSKEHFQQGKYVSDASDETQATITDENAMLKEEVESVLKEVYQVDSEMNAFVAHYNNERVVLRSS